MSDTNTEYRTQDGRDSQSRRPDPTEPPPPTSSLPAAAIVLAVIAALGIGILIGRSVWRAPGPAPSAVKQLWTCGMHPQVIQDHPGNCPICGMALEPVKADSAPGTQPAAPAGGVAVKIDPVVVQNMGVRVAQVSKGAIQRSVRAVGYLEEAQPNRHDVNLRIGGWIEKLYANTEGIHLKQGDPLFELYSPEIQVAVEEMIAARRQSATQPATSGADTAPPTSDVLYRAARGKLQRWGLDDKYLDELARLDAAPRTIRFVSPITGHVIEKMVVEGAAVQAGERVMRIVDHSTLWLDAQIYAQDLPLIEVGRKAHASVESFPGVSLEGKVIFIHPHISTETRTALVRLALPNPDLRLRPGMYATVRIEAKPTDEALLAPREAVIDTGQRRVVFVAAANGHFEPREVKTGLSDEEGRVQVLTGLAPGETIVTSGQFMLDAESRMREAIEKHLSDKLLQPAPKPEHQEHAAATAPATAPVVKRGHWTPAVDALVTAYLEWSAALGEKPKDQKPLSTEKFEAAAADLSKHLPDDAKPLAQRVADAIPPLAAKPLEEQRKSFRPLSDAVIALAERFPPSRNAASELYVAHCPMAPGDWLQTTRTIANPYYATTMKRCGEVLREVTLVEKQ